MANASLKVTTVTTYKHYYNAHLKEKIGDIAINKIDYNILQQTLDSIGKSFSRDLCLGCSKVIKQTFNYAYNQGYINRIPYAKLNITGNQKNKNIKEVITEKEFNDLLSYTKNKSYVILFNIAWYTGCRISEMLALEKSDFDFENNTINISKNIYYDQDKKIIGISTTKTLSSSNIIPLPHKLKEILVKWFEENESNIVIPNSNGSYILSKQVGNF